MTIDPLLSLGGVLVGYSVVAGVGFGMMYIPSVVSAAPFFKKRRSLAIGKLNSTLETPVRKPLYFCVVTAIR